MKTLSNIEDRQEVFRRLPQFCPEDQSQWGQMTAHQMVRHVRDSYCVAIGEKAALLSACATHPPKMDIAGDSHSLDERVSDPSRNRARKRS
jgi:hypothetical protein